MKSLTAFSAVLLWIALPAAMPAQKLTLPLSYSAEGRGPIVVAHPPAIANVPARHEQHIKTIWMVSIGAMLAGTTIDAISSWNKAESNALLASSNGMFGIKGAAIKGGIAAGVLTPQIVLRKRKDFRIAFTVGNFAEAGVFTGAAIHNFNVGAAPHRY